ncbi:MAG: hypothetical protein P1P86_16040 [Bacteroidales bacterium]|nr:hypothetical protein [Bacteroidales bacterium]
MDIIFSIYNDVRTVFRLNDVALLASETNFQSLNKKLNYYVRTGKLQNPRKGIYTKPGFSKVELACSVYTPSYISLEYVLQKAGVVFQYDSRMTTVSYLSRTIEVSGSEYIFRKIKGEILTNPAGIEVLENHVNMATPERAFLDLAYLNKDYYFDNLNPLNKRYINKLLRIYQSGTLVSRINRLLSNG